MPPGRGSDGCRARQHLRQCRTDLVERTRVRDDQSHRQPASPVGDGHRPPACPRAVSVPIRRSRDSGHPPPRRRPRRTARPRSLSKKRFCHGAVNSNALTRVRRVSSRQRSAVEQLADPPCRVIADPGVDRLPGGLGVRGEVQLVQTGCRIPRRARPEIPIERQSRAGRTASSPRARPSGGCRHTADHVYREHPWPAPRQQHRRSR